MTLRIDVVDWITGKLVIGNTGLGVKGSLIPSTGEDGASILYNDITLPADNDKEIRALVLTWPSAGYLFVYEDGSFSFTGAPDGTYTFTYQLYIDGTATGGVSTVTLNVGSGLNANGVSVATTTASITTQIRMAAGAFSVATSSASLTTAINLAANAVSVASATAELNVTTSPIYADAVSRSVATAELTTSVLLEAFAQARATGTANLTTGGAGQVGIGDKLTITYIADPITITLM